MMEKTKIQFSEEELDLMHNAQWILTKNRIIEKISAGLGELGMRIRKELPDFYPAIPQEICDSGFKVSRGEKYQGLPYIILDFPRIFGKQDILAIRVLFWWGKFFSVTLHTKGKYTDGIQRILLSDNANADEELMISNGGDEWNHDLDHQDYFKLKGLSKIRLAAALRENTFIKLSQRLDLVQWEVAERKLHSRIHKFLYLINLSFQAGETDL